MYPTLTCLSEEMLKAGSSVDLVPRPGEVKDPTQGEPD